MQLALTMHTSINFLWLLAACARVSAIMAKVILQWMNLQDEALLLLATSLAGINVTA